MCNVWTSIGESVNAGLVNSIFNDTYINAISDKFSATEVSNTNTVKGYRG